jgi:hypothetical protein
VHATPAYTTMSDVPSSAQTSRYMHTQEKKFKIINLQEINYKKK